MSEVTLIPRLTVLSDALLGVFTEVDPRFVAIGDRLGEAIGTFGQLSTLFEALHTTLNRAELDEAAASLRQIGTELTAMIEEMEKEREALLRLVDLNLQVGKRIGAFRRTVRAISMLAVNAQIAAADIHADGEDVSAFAGQFKELAQTTHAAIDAAARESDRLKRRLGVASTTHAIFHSTHGERLSSIARRLDASVRTVDAQRLRAAQSTSEIGQRSSGISERIGAAVMALQISDITRQRIEHVAEVLMLIARGLEDDDSTPAAAAEAWSDSLSEAQRDSIAARVCHLQSAQMDLALENFNRDVARIGTSLKALAGEAVELVRIGGEGYGDGEGEHGSFLVDLTEHLSATITILRDCEAERVEVDRQIHASTDSLRQLASELRAVQTIEADMRLVSQNTSLKCSRIGFDGRVLGVIAQRLGGYAHRMVADVHALMSVLDEIAAAADGFERKRQQHGGRGLLSLEGSIGSALGALQDSDQALGQALFQLRQEGSAVSTMLGGTVENLTGFGDVGRLLRAEQDRLAGITEAIEERPQDRAVVDERMRFFSAARYTMESEREIHAAIGGGAGKTPAARAEPALAESLDDIFF